MNYKNLAAVIRQRADASDLSKDDHELSAEEHDNAESLRCLARILEGKEIHRAFGAPGDWGYGTPIGDALAAAYRTQS